MELAKVTSKGQTTLPKKIRQSLGIRQGDLVGFELQGDRAILRRVAGSDDAYLKAVEATLGEWLTDADEDAFRDL